jgi:hypothetical protein
LAGQSTKALAASGATPVSLWCGRLQCLGGAFGFVPGKPQFPQPVRLHGSQFRLGLVLNRRLGPIRGFLLGLQKARFGLFHNILPDFGHKMCSLAMQMPNNLTSNCKHQFAPQASIFRAFFDRSRF